MDLGFHLFYYLFFFPMLILQRNSIEILKNLKFSWEDYDYKRKGSLVISAAWSRWASHGPLCWCNSQQHTLHYTFGEMEAQKTTARTLSEWFLAIKITKYILFEAMSFSLVTMLLNIGLSFLGVNCLISVFIVITNSVCFLGTKIYLLLIIL